MHRNARQMQRHGGCWLPANHRALAVAATALLLAGCSAVAAKTVHVVFGSHLDVGFNNIEPQIGLDNNVINKYFNEYYPRAVDVADEVARISGERYVYTTSCWLVSLFLDCPPGMGLQCPDAATRAKVLRGIRSGAINWHAHPHKADAEVYDRSLLEFATDLTHELDARFGQPPKKTLLLRDVPGITRAAIPILFAKGVRAISVGVNQGSSPPGVPFFTPFIWRDEASGTQLIAFWRPGGYGGWYEQHQLILDPPEQCISAPGLDHVLCTSWRWDNSGPAPDAADPIKMLKVLREDWGAANGTSVDGDEGGAAAPAAAAASAASDGGNVIITSTFDAFVDAVLEALPRLNLTVVTGEIGDSWIHGVGSDPLRVADFRAASRARAACVADPACPSQIPAMQNFSRLLIKVPEHTQGVDVKKTLADLTNWTNADFYQCLPPQLLPKTAAGAAAAAQALPPRQPHEFVPGAGVGGRDPAPCPNYEHCIVSWERQAAYVDWAIEALPPSHPVARSFAADRRARREIAAISPDSLAAAGAKAAGVSTARRLAAARGGGADSQQVAGVWQYTCGPWQLELDPEQGAISSLSKTHASGRQGNDWAGRKGARAAPPSPARTASASGNTFSDPALLGCRADGGAGVLGQLVYHAYSEASYEVIWDKYAWEHPMPWWFPGDFGKLGSGKVQEREAEVVARLEEVFETEGADGELQQLALRYSMPEDLVERAGAPRTMWTLITCPSTPAGELDVAVVWQDKTPTRLPEALWVGFQPAAGAVNPASWRMHKLGSPISPLEVIVNGSHSLHAVGDEGVSVRSTDGSELLQIKSFDAALASPGWPTVFPIVATKPCMAGGMHFNLVNNVWGTNFPMWVPFTRDQFNLTFRFQLQASLLGGDGAPAA